MRQRSGECFEPVPRLNPYYGKWVYRNLPVCMSTGMRRKPIVPGRVGVCPPKRNGKKRHAEPMPDIFPGATRGQIRAWQISRKRCFLKSLPVTRYPLGASPYGALNMAGNVREWVSDWFYNKYYFESPYENPTGPETGTERSLRGGAYDAVLDDITTFRRFKHEPDSAGLSRGFRCAESAESTRRLMRLLALKNTWYNLPAEIGEVA